MKPQAWGIAPSLSPRGFMHTPAWEIAAAAISQTQVCGKLGASQLRRLPAMQVCSLLVWRELGISSPCTGNKTQWDLMCNGVDHT